MKICLLKCGSVNHRLKFVSGDYEDMFVRLFSSNSFKMDLDIFKVYDGRYPSDLSLYDGFISSGSLSGVYDNDPWIKNYQKFIQHLFEKKYKHVGICFGHQMIAQALGGKVEKAKQGWGVGIKTLQIENKKPWMVPAPAAQIQLIFSHQDQVVKLPENAVVLASSDHCPVSIFMVDDHFLGIQAHPEFTKEYSRASIEFRKNIIDSLTVDKALDSLSKATDENMIVHWIDNFFKGHPFREK